MSLSSHLESITSFPFIVIDIDPLTKGMENESHKTSDKFPSYDK